MNTYKRHRFPSDVISYAYGSITNLISVIVILRICWQSEAFPSAMRRFDYGVLSLVQNMPIG